MVACSSVRIEGLNKQKTPPRQARGGVFMHKSMQFLLFIVRILYELLICFVCNSLIFDDRGVELTALLDGALLCRIVNVHESKALALARLANKLVKVLHSAKGGLNRLVVGNIVAVVVIGALVYGREPDVRDAERGEIVKAVYNASDIALIFHHHFQKD